MNDLQHPSTILDPAYVSLLRTESSLAEKNGKLTKAQMALVYEQKWLSLLAPSAYGGGEYSLPDVLALEEAIAWADGSVGWVAALCAGTGWFAGFADPGLAKKIFSDPKACIASGGMTPGTAVKTKNGYIVNGEWTHATGASEATFFTANCTVSHSGKPVKDEKGKDVVLSFLFQRNEVTILSTWNAIGLVATATNSYKVTDLEIPEDRSFRINDPKAPVNRPLYSYPFSQMAEAALSVNISGMALHFLDLCQEIFREKKNWMSQSLINEPSVQDTLDKQIQRLNDARTKLHYAVALSWQAIVNSKQIKEAILYKVSSGAYDLAKKARECVDALYPFCGLAAADKDCEINRVWRDIHTASQHRLLVFGGSD